MRLSGWIKSCILGLLVAEAVWTLATEHSLTASSAASQASWPWIALVSDVLVLFMLVMVLSAHLLETLRIRRNVRSFAKDMGRLRAFRAPSWTGAILTSAFLALLILGSLVSDRTWGLIVQATCLLYLEARAKEYGEEHLDSLKARILSVRGKTFPVQAIRAFQFKFTSGAVCLLVVEMAATCLAWMERLQYGFFDRGLLVGTAVVGLVVSAPIYVLMLIPYFFYHRKIAK